MTDARSILSVLVSSGSIGLLGSLIGAPIALARSSSRTSAARFAVDACAIGLFTLLVGITTWTWLGWSGALVYVAAIAAALTWSFRTDPLTRDHLRALRPRPGVMAATTAGLLVLAAVPRLRSINYITYTGDQGAYVNWANRLARQPVDLAVGWFDGPHVSTFPPLFSVFLAIPSRLFGPLHTTSAVPLTGLLLIAATLRLLDQLDARPTVRIASVVLVGWHVHAVWYSNFPLSETLQAPLVVLFLSCCIDVWRAGVDVTEPRRLPLGELATVSILALALGFNRGTAPLFMVPLLLILAGTTAPRWRAYGPNVARSAAAALGGLGMTHLYSSSEIRQYYVVDQIGKNLGTTGQELLERIHLLSPSPVSVGLIVGGVGGLLLLARHLDVRLTHRATTDDRPAVSTGLWPLPLTAALALACLMAGTILASSEIQDQIDRIGRPLALLALAGLLVPRSIDGIRGLAATFGAITGLSMMVIQSSRLGDTRQHSQFLYWDRYLFSELFPVLVVLAAMAATAGIEAVEARTSTAGRARAARTAAAAAPIVLAIAAALVAAPTVLVTLDHEPNDRAIEFLIGVDAKLGDEDVPILWGATEGTGPPDFGFPNSWHAYGLPLSSTFDHHVLNIPRAGGPFSPDPVLTTDDLVEATSCQSDGRVQVVEWARGGQPIDVRAADERLDFVHLGAEVATTPRLNQPHRSSWVHPTSHVEVYEVHGTPDATVDCQSLPKRLR